MRVMRDLRCDFCGRPRRIGNLRTLPVKHLPPILREPAGLVGFLRCCRYCWEGAA